MSVEAKKPVAADCEKAANAYVLVLVLFIAILPLPMVGLIASAYYMLAQRKQSYFVRWNCLQALLAQVVCLPFQLVAVHWTVSILFFDSHLTLAWILYMGLVLLLNLAELMSFVFTAVKVSRGEPVKWFLIGFLSQKLCTTP